MRALVFHGPWEMTVEDRPDPQPAGGDILLEIVATGICGSDLHGYTGENGRRHPGQIMGHETVGRVLTDPTGTHAAGSLVTVNPVLGCRACAACAAGVPQRCTQRRVIGVAPEIVSAFAERMTAPAHNIVPLPDGTPADVGSLVEPLAVGYHAARRGGVSGGDTVYVVGGGPIGQAVALAARRLGSTSIVAGEPDTTRRDLLTSLGFSTVDPTAASSDDVKSALGGPAGVVIDAVGLTGTLANALDVAALGGRVVLVGMGAPRVEVDAYAVSTAERTVLGSFCYDEPEFRDTARWASEHATDLEPLISGRVSLAEAPGTFRALADHTLTASKILVYPGQ
jgi:threonine dehydrogenase-like Zn-dependent dehydrogenase